MQGRHTFGRGELSIRSYQGLVGMVIQNNPTWRLRKRHDRTCATGTRYLVLMKRLFRFESGLSLRTIFINVLNSKN